MAVRRGTPDVETEAARGQAAIPAPCSDTLDLIGRQKARSDGEPRCDADPNTDPNAGRETDRDSDRGSGAARAAASRRRAALAALAPAVVLGVMGWHYRWLSDDGAIALRVAEQILAGHGPSFNAGERAEASTSVLWPWMLAAAARICAGADIGRVAVLLGLLCSTCGLALAGYGAARLWRPQDTGAAARFVPLGSLVVAALPPFWEYSTSGLETGLSFLWLGGVWALLCTGRVGGPTALTVGLGSLVRPDLGLASLAFLLALLLAPGAARGRWTRSRMVAAWGALPLAYEVFRAGYFGVLLPLPAIAKEAGFADPGRGWSYLLDTVGPYRLWIPVVCVAIALIALRHVVTALTLAAVGASCAMAGYVVAIGGDFAHARLLLPALFTLMLPVAVVPLRRAVAIPVTATAAWALVCAVCWQVPSTYQASPLGPVIAEYRLFQIKFDGVPHPIDTVDDVRAMRRATPAIAEVWDGRTSSGAPLVVVHGYTLDAAAALPPGADPLVVTWAGLGAAGLAAPLDVRTIDVLGLGYPLAAHVDLTGRSKPGHEKSLDLAWVLADAQRSVPGPPGGALPGVTLPDVTLAGVSAADTAIARRALACPALDDLRRSAADPLTLRRFARNLLGAFGRTSLRFSPDPAEVLAHACFRNR
jgi:arabinofuranosyltransferase